MTEAEPSKTDSKTNIDIKETGAEKTAQELSQNIRPDGKSPRNDYHLKRTENSRSKFIINQCFSYFWRDLPRALLYAFLSYQLVWSMLYVGVIGFNLGIQNDSFKNLQGADFVIYNAGDILADKSYSQAAFYRNIREVAGEGNYALTPWIVDAHGNISMRLFATDKNSMEIFDWKLSAGHHFTDNPNEVIAFKGAANVGDIISFEKDGIVYDFEVIGVYASAYLPVVCQMGEGEGSVWWTNSYRWQERDYSFVSDAYQAGFMVNPAHKLAKREYALYGGGAFVKDGILQNKGYYYNEKIKQIPAGYVTRARVGGWYRDSSNFGNIPWMITGLIKAVALLVLFLLFTFVEAKHRFIKYRDEWKLWNVCGMSAKEIKRTFTQVFAIATFLGASVGFVRYMLIYMRVTPEAWVLAVLGGLIVMYVLCYYHIHKRMFELYVNLVPNEEREFLCNKVVPNLPLIMNKTVRYNLRIPIELMGLNEEAVYSSVERGLGIGYIHSVSELKCKDLSDYELFRVKVARALTIIPDTLVLGSEWDKLNDKQKKEMNRFLVLMEKNWNLKIEFRNIKGIGAEALKELELNDGWEEKDKAESNTADTGLDAQRVTLEDN